MATTLVLFRTSPAYAALGKDLEARGFAFAHSDLPTGVMRPDGSSVIFSMDRARNVKTFEALRQGRRRGLRERDGRARRKTRRSCSLCSAARYGRPRRR